MAGESEEEKKEELLAHFHAYNQIFQAILKKVPGDPAAKKQRLGRLQQYIKTRIKDPDDFINHIPQFSKGLGIKEAALSSFIGSNFLRSLTSVKQKLAEQKAQKQAAAPAAHVAAAAPANASILVEVEHTLGPIVQPPARFELMELGLMKLITDSGEIMPTSFGSNGSAAPAPAAAATPGAPPASGTAAPADVGTPTTGDAPAPAAPPAPVLVAETPIIQEILDQFGSVLDVQGKLEPSNGLDEVMVPAAPAGESSGDGKNFEAYDAGLADVGATAEAAPVMVKKKREPEPPIIQEILDKFGSVFDVQGKLEPSDGLEGGNMGQEISTGAPEPGPADMDMLSDAAAPPPEETFEPIPLDFQQYINTMKKLQEFQKAPDQYRAWLSGSAGMTGKALVGLRNYMIKEKGGAAINWDDEYYNLSVHVGAKPAALRDLHERIRGFGEIQKMIAGIKSQLASRQPAFVNAIKKIWPQIILLFNQAEDLDSYNSQFKITLLQVPDAALKEELSGFMQPIFKELERIYGQS